MSVTPELWLRPGMIEALAARDVGAVFRALQASGVSQRKIAALTGQQQSEVSEIIKGRQVISYDLLTRIGDSLGVPRGRMGLAYEPPVMATEAAAPSVAPSSPSPLPDPEPAPTPSSAPPVTAQPIADRVYRWTGLEIRMLRQATRMSVREFAARLGVSDRMVSKWESGGAAITPRPVNQAVMDTCLRLAEPEARERFYAAFTPAVCHHCGLAEQR